MPIVKEHWTRSPEPWSCIWILALLKTVWLTIICKATCNPNLLLLPGSNDQFALNIRYISHLMVQWSHSLLHQVDKGMERAQDLDPENLCVCFSSVTEESSAILAKYERASEKLGNDLYSSCLTKCIHMLIYNSL